MLLPQVKPQDFVGVTYNGIRKVSIQDFERKPRPSLGNLTVQPGIGDSVLLAVTIYDIDLDEEIVYISWGYKRKSKGLDVPLFTLYSCQHNTSYAPPRLWEEIGNLPYPLVEPFQTIYRGPDISKDEVLHQPLFNLLIEREDLSNILEKHRRSSLATLLILGAIMQKRVETMR
jgi:hypothetical protein